MSGDADGISFGTLRSRGTSPKLPKNIRKELPSEDRTTHITIQPPPWWVLVFVCAPMYGVILLVGFEWTEFWLEDIVLTALIGIAGVVVVPYSINFTIKSIRAKKKND